MADKGSGPKIQEKCPTCGKLPSQENRSGSLTSYLFQPFRCNCSRMGSGNKPAASGASEAIESADQFCPRCGLRQVAATGGGSLTGFLFQDIRCKCNAGPAADENEMEKRFYQLKTSGAGTMFRSQDGRDTASAALGKKAKQSRVIVDLLPGSMIGGLYKIEKLIGQGGMGEVYLANNVNLHKLCALKVIPPDKVSTTTWQRFQNEARSAAAIDHANIVKVTDLGVHEGCLPFYAMEYVDGESLASMLEKHGPMTWQAALDIFCQVCDGVDFAHRRGLIHRDLKPGNIMLSSTAGGGFTVKILDFGLVKLAHSSRAEQSLTRAGEVFGSPFYMSPEQCMGEKIDNRSDIYSIGCTLFECLTGRPPFMGGSDVEILIKQQSDDPPTLASMARGKGIPESMELILAKLLRKNPVERYQTMTELKGDLEKVSKGETVAPFYVSRGKHRAEEEGDEQSQTENRAPLTVSGSGQASRLLPAALIATAVLCIGIAAVGFYSLSRRAKPSASRAKAGAIEITDNLYQP